MVIFVCVVKMNWIGLFQCRLFVSENSLLSPPPLYSSQNAATTKVSKQAAGRKIITARKVSGPAKAAAVAAVVNQQEKVSFEKLGYNYYY